MYRNYSMAGPIRINRDWTCKRCNQTIFAKKNICYKCNLDRAGNTTVRRTGDWICTGCNKLIFSSKDKCFKCNVDRNGNTTLKRGREGDWTCKGCNHLIFASKDKCTKCNIDRDGNMIDMSDNINDEKLCIICTSQPKNAIIVHKDSDDGHQVCCYGCANKIFLTTNNCPVCRQEIQQIIKVYG